MSKKPAPHLDLDWVLSAPTPDGKGYICGWVFENREVGKRTMQEIGRLYNHAADFVNRMDASK